MANQSVYFLEKTYPAKPEQNMVDMSVAYFTPKLALSYAKQEVQASKGSAVILKELGNDSLGVFVDVAGDLALIYQYNIKSIELKRV